MFRNGKTDVDTRDPKVKVMNRSISSLYWFSPSSHRQPVCEHRRMKLLTCDFSADNICDVILFLPVSVT